jgi:glycosyltransferase involved in cell wall biosynthesis
MRVLHLITGLAAGGAETQLRQLLRHSDYAADVVALSNAGCVADEIRADGRSVSDLGMRSNRQVAVLGRLTGLIRTGRYDVVHTHLYRAGLYGRIAARLANVPVVVSTEHSLSAEGRLEGRLVTPAAWGLYRIAERCGDLTVAVSAAVHRALRQRGIAAHRLAIVPNGIELDRYTFSAPDRARVRAELDMGPRAQVLGTVGRLHRWKNVDLAIRAAAPLLGPDRRFLVVGDGPERAALEVLAGRLGVGGRVHFVGERLDVSALLSAMDVFVFPSESETFGLAAVEALASGLPLVYRSCPALDECGAAGAKRHRVRLDEPALRAAMLAAEPDGADRRAPVELSRFDVRRTAERMRQIYHDLAGPRGARRHRPADLRTSHPRPERSPAAGARPKLARKRGT